MPSFFAICCYLLTFGSHKLAIHLCPPNTEVPQQKTETPKWKGKEEKKHKTQKGKEEKNEERKIQPREKSGMKLAYKKMWQANKLMTMLVD